MALDHGRDATTFEQVARARDAGVVSGLRGLPPEICDELSAMGRKVSAVTDKQVREPGIQSTHTIPNAICAVSTATSSPARIRTPSRWWPGR